MALALRCGGVRNDPVADDCASPGLPPNPPPQGSTNSAQAMPRMRGARPRPSRARKVVPLCARRTAWRSAPKSPLSRTLPLIGVRKVRCGNGVLTPQLNGIDAHLARGFIHQPLVISAASAAPRRDRRGGRGIRQDEAVPAIRACTRYDCADKEPVERVGARPGVCQVGTLVAQPVGAKREEAPVAVEAELPGKADSPAVRITKEVFRARARPPHRAAGPAGGGEENRVLGIGAGARTESAADVHRCTRMRRARVRGVSPAANAMRLPP